jgi:ARG/rhodanese/phosphatase superfamily protein
MTLRSNAAHAVVDAVQQVTLGPASDFKNLSIVPLLKSDDRDVDYLTLDEALAGGSAQITEMSDAGQVSELKVVVKGG